MVTKDLYLQTLKIKLVALDSIHARIKFRPEISYAIIEKFMIIVLLTARTRFGNQFTHFLSSIDLNVICDAEFSWEVG